MKERNVEELLANCPNLVDPTLRRMSMGRLGDRNVYLRQQKLPDAAGILDLAFITDGLVHVVEVKYGRLKPDHVHQVCRYAEALRSAYPEHSILGYLVGRSCPNRKDIEKSAANRGLLLTILTFPRDIPPPNRVKICTNSECQAGVDARDDSCPLCGSLRFV